MATIGNQWPTISDWCKAKDPNGLPAKIVPVLEKRNPILQDIPFEEGNLDTGHQITSQLSLPAPTYRRINQGVVSSKGTSEQVVEAACLMESRSEIDVEHPGIKAGGALFRLQQDKAFAQGFNNEVATGIIYNSTLTSPEKFHGLSPRLNATSGNPASAQILKCYSGASGNDQTSIWLVGWSPDTVFGFFPKGSEAGFKTQDLGQQLVDDRANAGAKFLAWVTRFVWRVGLAVADYRYVARLCNIDTSAAKFDGTEVNIPLSMEDAIAAIYAPDAVELRFYMNRWAFAALRKQAIAWKTGQFSIDWIDLGNRRVPAFQGIPIRVIDAITSTESVVS